ncbi:MAG: hypothetical protein ABIQ11_07845, partial [Saprospiraceae bacterium]
MKNIFLYAGLMLILMTSCRKKEEIQSEQQNIDSLAQRYVKLALIIGQYDGSFVDAYYGPDSLKPAAKVDSIFPRDSLLAEVNYVLAALKEIEMKSGIDSLSNRAGWIADQLVAFRNRIKTFSGEIESFDSESKELFGVEAPEYDKEHFEKLISELDTLLPGEGSVQERFQTLANRFIIPKKKLDAVFKAAIEESRKRTKAHYTLPEEESFT